MSFLTLQNPYTGNANNHDTGIFSDAAFFRVYAVLYFAMICEEQFNRVSAFPGWFAIFASFYLNYQT